MPDSEGDHSSSTSRIEEAMSYAARLHANQTRKGKSTPYLAHLLGVCALVMEDGGDEDEAIAALLHDAVEDQGGLATLAEIRRRFGDRVARIVDGCTDAYRIPKPPWRERKEAYIQKLKTAPQEVQRVSLADKVHNARSILADLHRDGRGPWEHFRGGRRGTLWYYRALIEEYQVTHPGYLVDELVRVVSEIEAMAGEEDS